ELEKQNINVRVVSMPCQELFDVQSIEYKESIIPSTCKIRYAIECLSPFGWEKYTHNSENIFGINTFGLSGNINDVKEKLSFTVAHIVNKIIESK
ncbi:MAG: transketolase-like TK C-terminal-containing protein, partial [Mycoplasmatales bacterium]